MKTKSDEKTPHRHTNGVKSKPNTKQLSIKVCRNWSKDSIDSALESLKANNYTLKYTSLKTGIPQDVLRQHAQLKNIKLKDDDKDEITDLDEDTETNDGNETDLSDAQNTDIDESSEFEEQQVLIDPPRTTTARKSTSPLKFFMKSYKISSNQRHFSSNLSTSSKSSETSSSTTLNNNTTKQAKQKQPVKQTTNNELANVDLKTIPLTNKIIDYVIKGPNTDFNLMDVHNFLQNKTKILEEIEKTIKIYSYLGLRQRYHPLFLNRTLSYMNSHKKKQSSNTSNKKNTANQQNGKNTLEVKKKRLETKLQDLHSKFKIKQLTENSAKTFELKLTFNYFQINNQTFIRELFNESAVDKTNPRRRKKANIEIYGISSNKSTLIGKCKCHIKTSNKTFTSLGNKAKLNFKLKENSYSYFLLRIFFKNTATLPQPAEEDQKDKLEDLKSNNPKKRKSNGILRKLSTTNKKNRTSVIKKEPTSLFNDPSIKQHEFFVVCSFSLQNQQKKLNLANPFSEFFKRTADLPLEKNDEFFLETKQIIYKKDKKKLRNYLNIINEHQNSDETDEENYYELDEIDENEQSNNVSHSDTRNGDEHHNTSNTSKKKIKNAKTSKLDTPTTTNGNASKKAKPEDLDTLLKQFYGKSDSFIINFSVETSKVAETITSPTNQRSSPRSKLAPLSKPLHIIPYDNNKKETSNSDDDIIIISPPTSPVVKRKINMNNSYGFSSKMANHSMNIENNIFNTSKTESNDKRLTRSAKSICSIDLNKMDHLETQDNKRNRNKNAHTQPIQIFYQFIKNETNNKLELAASSGKNGKSSKISSSNSNNKLLTQKFDHICPFCHLDCKQLNFLCFHFQMCHFRFQIEEQNVTTNSGSTASGSTTFISQAICNNNYLACTSKENSDETKKKAAHFNIRLDENFNGSYLGNPYDIHYAAHLGFSQSRVKPAKRNQVSFVLVNKKSNIFDLSQFKDLTQEEFSVLNIIQQQQQQLNCQMQPNNLYNCQAGIERLYYHTQTGQPIHVEELDLDSDNELDPDWLKEQTNLLIDEFDDVNEGEKDMMRLWNLHNIKFNYIPDCQFYHLCEMFIKEQTENIIKKNLFNNFILHLTNAFDYGLLTAEQMIKLNDCLHQKKEELLLILKQEVKATPIKSPNKRITKYNSPDKLNNKIKK